MIRNSLHSSEGEVGKYLMSQFTMCVVATCKWCIRYAEVVITIALIVEGPPTGSKVNLRWIVLSMREIVRNWFQIEECVSMREGRTV